MSTKLNLIPDPARSFRTPQGALVSYMEIDPEAATLMLNANTRNRTVSDRQVAQYGRALDANDWPFTGDAIRLGPNGLVLDGQHRLLAIEKTGKPMCCLVVSDLDAVVQRYLDSGRKRSAADQCTLDGIANATMMTACARLVLSWGFWRTDKCAVSISNAEVSAYLLDNIGLIEAGVKSGMDARKALARVSGSAIATAYVRAIQVTMDPFLVANFFTKLASGAELKEGEPLHTLRNHLIRADQANQIVQLWQVVRAWNATQEGTALGKIQLPRGGVTVTKFPDMKKPRIEEELTTLDEEAAEAVQKLREPNAPAA